MEWYEDTNSEEFKIMLQFPALWGFICPDKETYDSVNGIIPEGTEIDNPFELCNH